MTILRHRKINTKFANDILSSGLQCEIFGLAVCPYRRLLYVIIRLVHLSVCLFPSDASRRVEEIQIIKSAASRRLTSKKIGGVDQSVVCRSPGWGTFWCHSHQCCSRNSNKQQQQQRRQSKILYLHSPGSPAASS